MIPKEPQEPITEEQHEEAIERGFGLLAGSGTVDELMQELKEERQRDDDRFLKWFAQD